MTQNPRRVLYSSTPPPPNRQTQNRAKEKAEPRLQLPAIQPYQSCEVDVTSLVTATSPERSYDRHARLLHRATAIGG
jgi:hypothetical protein